MTTEIQKGKSVLRPRARIIKTIGEELISNDIVAIIELVKNSYDADSKKVEIIFDGKVIKKEGSRETHPFFISKGQGSIVIKDYGTGMTLDTIQKGWMEPATTFKKINSNSKGMKRRFLGEKGVGRFASARLSRTLEVVTRVKEDNEIFAVFNWEEFGDDDKYLDEVDCVWEVRKPEVIKDNGTMLIMESLNLDWDYEKLQRLRTALSRLVNPVAPVKNFEINLILPEQFMSISGEVSSPLSLGKPDYKIKGSVDKNANVSMTYTSRQINSPEHIKQSLTLKPSRKPLCGAFEFEFRVWNREPESLRSLAAEVGSSFRDIRRDLNEASGISVYRDNFRVMPYGEPNNDWLRLDFRRVQNPTLRLSNNQVIGYVSVCMDENKELRDQSNREGIIESKAFKDFQEMIIAVLATLEDRKYKEKRPQLEQKQEKEGLFSAITIEPVIKMVEKKLPNDKEAKEVVARTENQIKEGIKKIQEVVARYRRLSSLGQLLDIVLHDGSSMLLKIDNETLLLEKEFKKETINEKKIKKHIDLIKNERKVLSELFKRLEPFSGRKRGRPKNVILEEAIKNVFVLHKNDLDKLKIKFSLPESKTLVRLDESEFEMIILNLLQNSLYWLESQSTEKKEIVVQLSKENDVLILLFSDSGPGVSEKDTPYIFDPYYTTKPDGIGLGLTHVGELVSEYDGTLELVSGGPLNGATFKLTFMRRV